MTEVTREEIYRLDDHDLSRALVKLLAHPVEAAPLTDWEKAFCIGAANAWARFNSLTWKQRRLARLTLLRVLTRIVRHTQVREWLDEEAIS